MATGAVKSVVKKGAAKAPSKKRAPGRPSKLTPKQARFVEEYLVDLNATQAAIRAGYSAKTAGQIGEENLRKPEIAKAIAEAREARSIRTQITQDRVLEELAKIGFADIRRAVKWRSNVVVPAQELGGVMEMMEETGELPDMQPLISNQVELVNSDDLDPDTAAAISEVSMSDKGSLKLKFHDKQAALVNLGKHLGIFTDKVEHGGAVTVEIVRFGGGDA
ncbi:MAG: terminase small subunit [Sphingomonas oligoaromativorans]